MQFLKETAAVIDRQIERDRLWQEYNILETFEQRKTWWAANQERINAQYPKSHPAPYAQGDYEPSGYQRINKGNMGS